MVGFVYRCLITGKNAHAWTEESASDDTYESVLCARCGRLHFVNPATGEVLGAEEQEPELGDKTTNESSLAPRWPSSQPITRSLLLKKAV
jgi:hypothetical protein